MNHQDAVDHAWRIHASLIDWTGKVDTKASFALTIESAVLAGVVTLAGKGHHLHDMHGCGVLIPFWLGVAALVIGVAAAASVVTPQIRQRKVAAEWRENVIFFGHLKEWDPKKLEEALEKRDILPVLSRQLVVMSKIAWNKHRLLQASMLSGALGTLLIFVAYLAK